MAVSPTPEDLIAMVRGLAAEILEVPVEEIPVDADLLKELGLDSLQQLELMSTVESQLGLHLDIDDWLNGRNVLDLAERARLQLRRPASA